MQKLSMRNIMHTMPLAHNLRPTALDEFVGQTHLVGKEKVLYTMLEKGQLYSMIFWGPPGVGKTTLAHIIAQKTDADFHLLSGVASGKAELTAVVAVARGNQTHQKKTILFIDEIHRWNKAQQDALLPYVESGLITLIGATTENPSFEIISALLSRCRVFVLQPLTEKDLTELARRALTDETKGIGKYKKSLTDEAQKALIHFSGGDARILLTALEIAATNYKEKTITPEIIEDIFQRKAGMLYDKKGEEHYNIISAFIKSMRGSDPDATLYYLHRMLEAGEDPKFIARRMIVFASEDIGLADRGALIQANAAFEAVHKIGLPEAALILTHAALYLATAKKSRAIANAMQKAQEIVQQFPNEPVPLHLRNAPTKLMKELGYAQNYQWTSAHVGPINKQSFLPEKLKTIRIV